MGIIFNPSKLFKPNLIVWACSINGEGSSVVSYSLLSSFSSSSCAPLVFLTAGSKLDILISRKPLRDTLEIFRLPSIFSSAYIQAFVKLLCPVFLNSNLFVLDDFPFLFAKRQVVYFHQPNLIFAFDRKWRLRRLFFRLTVRKDTFLIFQTEHIRRSFLDKFKNFRCRSAVYRHYP